MDVSATTTTTTTTTTRERERKRKRTGAHIFAYLGGETSKKSNSYSTRKRRRKGRERARRKAYPTTATERCQSAEEPASVGGWIICHVACALVRWNDEIMMIFAFLF